MRMKISQRCGVRDALLLTANASSSDRQTRSTDGREEAVKAEVPEHVVGMDPAVSNPALV